MHGKNLTKQTTSNCRLRTLCSRCWADETLLGHNKTNKTCRYKEVSEWVSMTEQTRFESQLYAITLATFVGRESAASLARFLAVDKCGVTKPFMNWRFSCRLHFAEDESLTSHLTCFFMCISAIHCFMHIFPKDTPKNQFRYVYFTFIAIIRFPP